MVAAQYSLPLCTYKPQITTLIHIPQLGTPKTINYRYPLEFPQPGYNHLLHQISTKQKIDTRVSLPGGINHDFAAELATMLGACWLTTIVFDAKHNSKTRAASMVPGSPGASGQYFNTYPGTRVPDQDLEISRFG